MKLAQSILVAAAVIGTSTFALSYAMAQQARSKLNGPASSQDGPMATKSDQSLDPVRQSLAFAVTTLQGNLLDETDSNTRREHIILACNRSMLSINTPAEQQASIRDFLQIDKYMPHEPKWQAMKQVKSKVNKLLGASQRAQDVAEAAFDAIWDDIMNKRCPGPTRKPEQRIWLGVKCDEMRAKVEAELTPDQKAEYRGIWNSYLADLEAGPR